MVVEVYYILKGNIIRDIEKKKSRTWFFRKFFSFLEKIVFLTKIRRFTYDVKELA